MKDYFQTKAFLHENNSLYGNTVVIIDKSSIRIPEPLQASLPEYI